jgi:hypothetical protein
MALITYGEIKALHSECLVRQVAFMQGTAIYGTGNNLTTQSAFASFANGNTARFYKVNGAQEHGTLFMLTVCNSNNELLTSGVVSRELLVPLFAYYSNL